MAKTRGGSTKPSAHVALRRESDSEESSRYASRDEDDPLSLTICARDILAYRRESKLNKVLRKGENFHFKVTRNKNITGAKLMRLINSNKLNKEQKLKCSLVLFVHSILLSPDRSKIVDSNHIKMEDDLNFFKSYPWGKQSFDLTLTYLKNRINLRK
ncbi:hypothetical protein H5410_004182 [Solanum commersonii]|uniref:DUF1985 domain-containing protein n=1 Tax=Solanum commersonii TaxID=4109 RepID=A0A9J6B716_SOLCO|nr:hypothetical protein H5410_004182 [Solanum commersonii]